MDLTEKEYTYANLVLLQIRRDLNAMLHHFDYSDSELVNIALDIMRILIDISSGVMHTTEENEREWDLFFQAQKDEKDFKFLIHDLYMKSKVKNELLNEVINNNKTEDLEKLIKQTKGEL